MTMTFQTGQKVITPDGDEIIVKPENNELKIYHVIQLSDDSDAD